MADLGSLYVKMSLESAQFVSGLKAAAAQSQATNKVIADTFGKAKAAVGGFLAVLSVDAFISATKRAFDYADAIVDLSDRTGATTKSIQEMRYAAQMTGSDFQTADAAIDKFARNLGNAQAGSTKMAAVFKSLGVNIHSDFDTALRAAMDGISKLPTVAQRNAAALTLFGKSTGSLTLLLGQGTKGFKDFADEADNLGVVLGDDLLRNAGQVNDRLDQLHMLLDAKFAGMVAQNADAIGNLAEQVINLVGAFAQFWSQNPTKAMAIMGAGGGAIAGGAVGSILPGVGTAAGAVVGGIGGGLYGAYLGYTSRTERQKIAADNAAIQDRLAERNPDGSFTESDATRKKLAATLAANNARLAAIAKQEQAQAAAQALLGGQGGHPGPDGTFGGPPPKPDKTAEREAKKARDRDARFASDLSSANVELLSAKQGQTSDIVEQSALEREMLDIEVKRRKAAIDADVADGRYTKAQGDALKAMEDRVAYEKVDLVNIRENEELARQRLDIAKAGVGNQMDILSGEQALARSSSQRQAIALRLIDLQYQQEKLQLDAILASKTATAADKAIAQARLDVLDQIKNNDIAQAKRENAGPLGQYLQALPSTTGEIQDSLSSAAVDGLDSLTDKLADVVTGTGSVAAAFSDMATSIIKDIARIALQEAIIKPLGSLFGGVLKGVGGLIAGSLGGGPAITDYGGASVILGARANGGLTRPGSYLVGERGREIINVGNTANTVPNHALRAVSGGGRGVTINFGNITSNDPAMVKVMASQAIMESMPLMLQQGANYTTRKLRRPVL